MKGRKQSNKRSSQSKRAGLQIKTQEKNNHSKKKSPHKKEHWSPTITHEEWKWVTKWSMGMLIVALLPILFGYFFAANENLHFVGVLDPVDANTYFDYMNQAKEGKVLYINSYTSEYMQPFLFRPLFGVMGILSILLPSILVWHIARLLSGALLLCSAYYFFAMTTHNEQKRRIAFLFLCFSSGLGWLTLLVAQLTGKQFGAGIDFKQSAITFLTLQGQPHTIISVALIIVTFILYLKAVHDQKLHSFIYAGLTAMLLGFIHVFDVITLWAVLIPFTIIKLYQNKYIECTIRESIQKHCKTYVYHKFFFLLSGIPLVYYAALLLINDPFAEWGKQNIITSPNPWGYLLGYGFLLLFVAYFFITWYSRERITSTRDALLLTILWFVIQPFLLYSPLKIEGRFIEGFHIPVVLLAAWGCNELLAYYKDEKRRKAIFIGILLVLSLSNMVWMGNMISELGSTKDVPHGKYDTYHYLTSNQMQALNWLSENTQDEVILSNYYLGNMLPRYSQNRVFLGHWAQTIAMEEKWDQFSLFFALSSEDQKAFIGKHSIQYILLEKNELYYQVNYPIVFENEETRIYKTS